MALQKNKIMMNGILANYWRIRSISLDVDSKVLEVVISLYLDKNARIAGAKPFVGQDKHFILELTKDQMVLNLQELAYALIKEKATEMVPNLDGNGTHIRDADLANSVDA
jgi:hypothetical protein